MAGMTRRVFVSGFALSAFGRWGVAKALIGPEQRRGSGEGPADSRMIDKWMTAWMEGEREPIGALHVSRFSDPMYYLLKPITWKPNPGQEDLGEVTVPVGFVTDFTSIPRVFFTMLRPDGVYTYSAIVHDYLYWTQSKPRDVCDKIFKLGMEDFNVSKATINSIYTAVRAGGGVSWDNNLKRKKRGEKRILKKFPEDPRIRWADWSKRPDVFE